MRRSIAALWQRRLHMLSLLPVRLSLTGGTQPFIGAFLRILTGVAIALL
jgi:hypothetical protein